METSINMRIFKTILLVIALAAVSVDASPLLHYTRDRDSRPADRNEPSAPVELKKDATDHYDQRQNGTENYRVKVDGLVFIMAPADSLLLAGAALEPSNFNFEQLLGDANKPISKPKPDDDAPQPKPQKDSIPKSSHHDPIHAGHKSVLRISNLIAPFLKRMHHSQQSTK
ncbi:uncharacterized protein LOC100117581 [Nasonia vitripennis]|uniref:Uncharacterized protein n=1 Tax=Nasonia vitripennis TaxID=7425 RepID=A0A7M7IUW7_NASVI|nr:uncharacterized protein LOC100117581 [Nasonia vitripennis]